MGLFRRSKKQPLDRIGAFGKLPFSPEFIKSYGGHLFVKHWDHWFQQAYRSVHYTLGDRCKAYFQVMPDYQFVHYNGPNQLPYVGSVFNCQDAGGRRYPFVIVREIKTALAYEFSAALPLFYEGFLAHSEYWIQNISYDLTMKQLNQAIQHMAQYNYPLDKPTILPYTLQQLRSLTVADVVASEHLETIWQWQQCHQQWLKNCRQILQNPQQQVIALPIQQTRSLRTIVVFYLQLLHELVNLNHLTWQLYWQWGSNQYAPQCYLSLRSLQPSEWQVFIDPDYQLSNLYNQACNDSQTLPPLSSAILKPDTDLLTAIECLINTV